MIVEIVAIGTELLIGSRVNTNATRIAERLAGEGLDCHHQVVVGDNLDRITAAIVTAIHRADSVILTGGIGPTHDDLTREAICAATGRTMVRDEAHARWIAERIATQRREVSPNQLRMADLPEGADSITNDAGVALGIALDHEGCLVFALPGVPGEMIPMLETGVLPRLRDRLGGPSLIRTRVIKVWGIGESIVANRIDGLTDSANPTLALLIKEVEVQIRITAKADDEGAAQALIAPMEREVVARLGDAVFAFDEDTVEDQVHSMLTERDWTISTREQATLGRVGAQLASSVGELYRGTLIPGYGDLKSEAPEAHVLVTVGPAGPDRRGGRRTTRPVEVSVSTPERGVTEVFEFGGNEERLQAFATAAALHQVRLAVSQPAE